MRATSFGVPLKDSRSLSKISTPVKPAAAVASSFSARPPASDTVAIEVCIRAFGGRRGVNSPLRRLDDCRLWRRAELGLNLSQ